MTATDVNAQTTRTAGETYTGGWFRTTGDTGWYSEKWGGGFYMSDSSWIRAYQDKGIYTGGQLQGGTVQSNGRMTAGEYLQINGQALQGGGCSPNGLQGRTPEGAILSCVNGVWTGAVFNGRYVPMGGYTGSTSGNNTTGKPIKIYAYGGNPPPGSMGVDANNCGNTYALVGVVNGVTVANAVDFNGGWNKSGSISFDVPSGGSWSIISGGLPAYGCGPGSFSVISYQ